MPYPSASRGNATPRNTVTGVGTIVQATNQVTGTSTLFQSQVAVGDRLVASGINGTVLSIASNLLITLSNSATQAVGQSFTIQPG